MMPRILVAAAMLFAFANANALRVLNPVENAVEVSLSNLTLPSDAAGTVTLRECTDCPYSNHRLGDGATFRVDRKAATFEEMRDFVAATRLSRAAIDNTIVTVFLDVNTARITRISMRRSAP